MAIKVIVELQAKPGRRAELKSSIESIVSKQGSTKELRSPHSTDPYFLVWQYIASGLLGEAAFAGGMTAAVLGVFLHWIISMVIAAVFFLSADRLPRLHRYAIPGSLRYGFGVFLS